MRRANLGRILVAYLLMSQSVPAATVCNVSGLGPELYRFTVLKCDGVLGHREAIDCVNKLAEDLARQRQRAESTSAQAECLCGALNEAVAGYGRYSRLNGACVVERLKPEHRQIASVNRHNDARSEVDCTLAQQSGRRSWLNFKWLF